MPEENQNCYFCKIKLTGTEHIFILLHNIYKLMSNSSSTDSAGHHTGNQSHKHVPMLVSLLHMVPSKHENRNIVNLNNFYQKSLA